MVNRPPLLVSLDTFMDEGQRSSFLPDHAFHIGEDGHASIDQFPALRPLAFYVIGKAPMPPEDCGGQVDTLGTGRFALGALFADAHLKLMRPWPLASGEPYVIGADDASEIGAICDQLQPAYFKTDATKAAFLGRIGEFMDIALHHPERLPAIIAAIDVLTNERLTARARAVLESGIDPGRNDLWTPDAAWWKP